MMIFQHLAGAFADQQTCRATDSTNTTKETRKRHEKCRKRAETAKNVEATLLHCYTCCCFEIVPHLFVFTLRHSEHLQSLH